LLLVLGTAVMAEPAYKASEIVKHFTPSESLGSTRGLCIGTEAECNGGAAVSKPTRPPEGFDLVVTFDYDSDVLTGQARENLDEFYRALRDPRLDHSSFIVEGHTDAKGTDRYNLILSQRRANAVVRYLAGKGISAAKLEPRGLGKSKPRTDDPFDAANRRVETRLRTD
jgi:outer membrane protein OmpA-like peptidoglycan-associated protein